jgi:FtsZ-binding cell division protein ZapB
MARGKHKNISNKNHGYLASSEPSFPTIAILDTSSCRKKQDFDLTSLLMMITEEFKKDINNSLKEKQDNTGKQVEALKEEAEKSLKELQENTNK